jgi:hypothetical protein
MSPRLNRSYLFTDFENNPLMILEYCHGIFQ